MRHDDIAITALGEIARSILSSHTKGTVLAVFRRSFYLQVGEDVVCIGPQGLGNGPLNILVSVPADMAWSERGLAPRQNASRAGTLLSVGARLRFELQGAQAWRAPVAAAFSVADLQQGLRLLAASAQRRGPGGLGAALCMLTDMSAWSRLPDDPLLRAAKDTMTAVQDWMQAALNGSPDAPPPVAGLIGLGPGLTPSGDDFLCGAMVALNYLGCADIAQRLAASVLPVAARETGLISAAYLRCAAVGQASAVLFGALESLLAAGCDLEPRIDAVHAVGHTSGWDSLVGAATACAAWAAAQVELGAASASAGR